MIIVLEGIKTCYMKAWGMLLQGSDTFARDVIILCTAEKQAFDCLSRLKRCHVMMLS